MLSIRLSVQRLYRKGNPVRKYRDILVFIREGFWNLQCPSHAFLYLWLYNMITTTLVIRVNQIELG
ncbi:MAG: hypothetical protein KAI83_18685 [Thiomargarita sp.]|nr:hypothetical protein [Thiomargarita sp.]